MKNIYLLLTLSIMIFSCGKNGENSGKLNNIKQTNTESNNKPGYDEELAKKTGADKYGMKKYVIAYLKRGPNRNQDSATAANLQRAHLENISRMAEEGKLVLAGPFLDDDEIRGIYVFNVETIEEAKALSNTDPAVKSGRLVLELHPWYGSAALMEINSLHKRIAKENP